jgi:hypothetical protein
LSSDKQSTQLLLCVGNELVAIIVPRRWIFNVGTYKRSSAGNLPARSVPLFIGGQIVGAVAATLFGRWLLGPMKEND